MITLTFPFRTPTVNNLYYHRGNIKVLKTIARELRKEIQSYCDPSMMSKLPNFMKGLKVTVEIQENWYTKQGNVKKKDVMNREKFLTDSVFQGLGIDDKYVFEYHIKKVQRIREKAIVVIEEIR